MPELSVEDVTMRFGARLVLDSVTLRVRPGALTLLTGRSGSGKSTLLNVLAGLQTPTRGRILVDGQHLDAMDEEERTRFRLQRVGLVFQDFRLIADLTVEENVRLPMTMAGRRDAKKRALELLSQVGMKDRATDFPETLSGGEAQRTAVARALANEPAVILADEPTANLDEPNARKVLSLLGHIARSGRIVLVASHDPLAIPYAEHRMTLRQGRLVPFERTDGSTGAPGVALASD